MWSRIQPILYAYARTNVIDAVGNVVLDKKLDSFLKIIEENAGKIHDIEDKLDKHSTKMENLQTKIDSLQVICARVQKNTNELEQYSRRNCLRIFGLPESQHEDTNEKVVNLAKSKLGVNIDPSNIDRSHRIGKPTSTNPRPIIVKFTSYAARARFIKSRRQLKGTNVVVKEDLTKTNQQLLQESKKHAKVKSAWSHDGKIIVLVNENGNDRTKRLFELSDLERL